jgi:glucokinase
MDNDAILALLGECRFGSGRGYNDVLLLTLGTGIGGGLLLNGTLRRGPHGLGCEVGMLPFPDPTIDHLTAFESIASPKSIMQRLGDPSGHLFDRALHGDPVASAAIDEMYRLLGWLVTNLHVVLDLELVILSGGLAGVGQPLREGVLAAFRDVCPPELQFGMQVRMGTLPPQAAGVIGAACLYLEPEMVPNT